MQVLHVVSLWKMEAQVVDLLTASDDMSTFAASDRILWHELSEVPSAQEFGLCSCAVSTVPNTKNSKV